MRTCVLQPATGGGSHRVPLVRRGRKPRDDLRRENITDGELASQRRVQGVDDLGEVEEVLLAADGRPSVVRKGGEPPARPRPRQP